MTAKHEIQTLIKDAVNRRSLLRATAKNLAARKPALSAYKEKEALAEDELIAGLEAQLAQLS